jgi:ferritin-like metal-binding protein YciE
MRHTFKGKIMATKRKSSGQSGKQSPDATELLVLELQEIHSAESQLSRVLPRLAKALESEELGRLMDERLAEGERIIKEIEAVFEEMDESPGRKKNVAAEGLINDAREHVQEIEAGPALDAVLIGAIQKTEHYCIAAWGTAKALAEAVGQKTAVRVMERALKEGAPFDERLTKLAAEEITPALLAAAQSEDDQSGTNGEKGSGRKRGSQNQASA